MFHFVLFIFIFDFHFISVALFVFISFGQLTLIQIWLRTLLDHGLTQDALVPPWVDSGLTRLGVVDPVFLTCATWECTGLNEYLIEYMGLCKSLGDDSYLHVVHPRWWTSGFDRTCIWPVDFPRRPLATLNDNIFIHQFHLKHYVYITCY